jgi:hypothetical protein
MTPPLWRAGSIDVSSHVPPRRRWLAARVRFGTSRLFHPCLTALLAMPLACLAGDKVSLAGTWVGHYRCAQGNTGLTLDVNSPGQSHLHAVFHFYADRSESDVPDGCFEMDGTYDPSTRRVDLRAGKWILRPDGYVTVGLGGEVSADGSTMTGAVEGPGCDGFEVRHVAASSPRVKKVCPLSGTIASLLIQP